MNESIEIYAAAADVFTEHPITIPLTQAFLCADPDCSIVANTAQKCPVCHSSMIPLSGIVNQTATELPPPVSDEHLGYPEQRLGSMGLQEFFAR